MASKRAYVEMVGAWQMAEISRTTALTIIRNAKLARHGKPFRRNGIIVICDPSGYEAIHLTTTVT